MYQDTESGRSETGPFVIDDYFFMTVFVRRPPVKHNTSSECIRIVSQRIVVKFYNYTNTMRTCTDTMRTANDTPRIPVHTA